MIPRPLLRLIVGLHKRRKGINAWVVRVISFYFGYRILHHEVFEVQTSEPLLVFLGLWLCGIAPATFFDSLRDVGVKIQNEIEAASDVPEGKAEPEPPTAELESPHEEP